MQCYTNAGKTVFIRLGWLLVIAGCILVYLKNYWLAEDSYINFRSLDQLWAGRGPVWNVGERVQVYTSALWYWLVAASRFFINDNYLATFACSFVLYLAILEKITRMQAGGVAALLAVALLLSSNSFMDFSASGLENVLIYFLLLHFFQACIQPAGSVKIKPYLMAGLLLTARHDLLTLVMPACLSCMWNDFRRRGMGSAVTSVIIGMLPFIAWEFFSLIYYGFPFPNTAYAKLSSGIAMHELASQGITYVVESSIYDPILPVVIALGVLAGLAMPATRWLAAGVVINVAYIVSVGGDYMRGRFFTFDYLLGVLLIMRGITGLSGLPLRAICTGALLTLLPYLFVVPFNPIGTSTVFSDHLPSNETANERGRFYYHTSLFEYFSCLRRREDFPTWPFYTDGLKLKEQGQPWYIMTNIGMGGYAIGIDSHIFDRLGLSDPLLARLPISLHATWSPGHYARDIPWGYPEANLQHGAEIYDPDLDKYYAYLKLITRSEALFSRERLTAIMVMNSPASKKLLESHIEEFKLRGCKACLPD